MGKREFAIEYGIPCPGPKGSVGPRTEFTKAVHSMQIGGSILCETETEVDTARKTIKQLGGRCQARKMDGGWRVWRVEK